MIWFGHMVQDFFRTVRKKKKKNMHTLLINTNKVINGGIHINTSEEQTLSFSPENNKSLTPTCNKTN